jgi:DNA-binding MarR family transcriptional regulator
MKEKYTADIRSFNRFYTGVIGLLNEYIYNSRYTLPEVRVMYELYHHDTMSASEIISLLKIDKGYLSRLLKQFEKKKLINRKQSPEDARSSLVQLTTQGRKEFEILNKESDVRIESILEQLTNKDCDELMKHMQSIRNILNKVNYE